MASTKPPYFSLYILSQAISSMPCSWLQLTTTSRCHLMDVSVFSLNGTTTDVLVKIKSWEPSKDTETSRLYSPSLLITHPLPNHIDLSPKLFFILYSPYSPHHNYCNDPFSNCSYLFITSSNPFSILQSEKSLQNTYQITSSSAHSPLMASHCSKNKVQECVSGLVG